MKRLRYNKDLLRVVIATALVLAVSASLWFAAPVQAAEVSIQNLPATMYRGRTYTFYAQFDINTNESIPIIDFRFDIDGPTPAYAVFSVDGTMTDYSPQFVSIELVSSPYYGYSDRYGYGYGYQPPGGYGYFEHQWGYGYGYGYGYGGYAASTLLRYRVQLDTTGMDLGSYTIQLAVNVPPPPKRFLSPKYDFDIIRAPTPPPPEEEEEEITGEILLDEAEQDIEAAGDALQAAAEQDIEAAGDALQDAAEQDTETAGAILGEVAEDNPEIAGGLFGEVAKDNPEIASDLLEEIAEDNPGLAGDILENTDAEQAAAAMEQTDTDTLNKVIPEMSEESLTERLPEMSADKLGDIDAQTLFDALPNAPIEQLTGEDPPQPPADLTDPIVRYETPQGGVYVAVRTESGEWVIVGATPPPVDLLMIKTKRALENVETTIEIYDELPSGVTVAPSAEQIIRAYITITFKNATPADIEAGHITFYVEKDWLEQNSIHKWSVFLNRYDPELEQWITLPTKRVDEDDTKVYYTSVIAHFSVFAISGSETLPPVNFEVANLVIDPVEAETGEGITISASVTNVSDEDNTYVATLWIDKTVETAIDIYLQVGETKPVSFIVTRDVEGIYEVRVDRLFSSFSVTEVPPVPPVPPAPPAPAEFAVTDLSVSPAEIETGQTVTISALVTNIGEEEGNYWVTLEIDGISVDIQLVTLEGGASQKVTFTTSKDAAGTYSVSIDELSDTFTVEEAVEVLPEEEVMPPAKPAINYWPLVGGIIGGVIVVGLAIWLIIWWRRRRYSI